MRANCRAKYARQCSHWRKARKASYRAQAAFEQEIVYHDLDYVEPLEEEKPIDYDDPLDEEDNEDSCSSYATIASVPVDVQPSQAQDYFLQLSPQAPQVHQQPFGTQLHPTRPPHQHYAKFYQPPGPPQHPIFHQPQHSFYQIPPVPQHQPYLVNQLPSMHPPMHTSCTWTQQPMPPAQWSYPPYPSYPFHQPYSSYGPAPGIEIHRPPVPQPDNPSTFCDLFKRPLPSHPMVSSPQPQQTFDVPPNQLTSNSTLNCSTETEQHLPSNKRQLRTPAPKLRVLREQPQVLPCVAPTQLDQRVRVAQDAQIVIQMQPEQNIEASRLAARRQLEQNVQAAQAALNKSRTTVEQQNPQIAGHKGLRSLALFPMRTLPANEPQATTPQQQIRPQTQSLNLTPIPHYLSSNVWPSLAPQTEPPPKSLPLSRKPFIPSLHDLLSRSHADRDRDTLGVSISADQHEIRAAYWVREFECHPARHRESTSPFRAVMGEQLAKAQEAVDRLGGFAGMSWGLWEGLDEYSNHYDLIAEVARSEK